MDAILPAGGRISGRFAAEAGSAVKALISLGGRTVLERTLQALRATGRIGRIVIIGPAEVASHAAASAADAVLPEAGTSGPANIQRGLDWVCEVRGGEHTERVLILTTDLPFLTGDAIAGFLDACSPESDLSVPVISRRDFRVRFPGSSPWSVRLRDGDWMVGCSFLVNPSAIIQNRAHIEKVFAVRKNPIAMARLLGARFIWRFLTRRLTLAEIEARCLTLLGCTGHAILGCAPELAFDIDRPRDYRYAARNQHRMWEAAP